METDFLNLHDEEHFGTGLYQNELFDDSQGSILDIVGDNYTRQDSNEYMDNSVIWDQEEEREINGDVAVIPMTSSINSFPKLSNSPPTKDFQKIFSDWQEHLATIETPDQDLSVDLHLPSQNLDINLDYITPIQPQSPPKPIVSKTPIKEEEEIKKVPEKPIRPGGKNLALLKAVQEKIYLDTSFKSEGSIDELDILTDNFDITSYIIGQDFNQKKNPKGEEQSVSYGKKIPKGEKKSGSYGKKIENIKTEEVKICQEENDDDIDVETVSEASEMPVLEARDLTSLLEQFEASEAVNPKVPKILFDSDEKLDEPKPTSLTQPPNPLPVQETLPKEVKVVEKNKNQTLNKVVNKNISDALPIELIQKIKASCSKKSISVIPAMPKKSRSRKEREEKNKLLKLTSESIQLDHDYCSVSPAKISRNQSRRNSSDSDKKSPERKTETPPDCKKQIDDTAIRIETQIKNAINKQKNKTDLLKYQPIKNANGQLMVSLLKTNRNVPIIEKDSCQAKKRKLNLEEYKKLRGDIIKSNENSGANSPSGVASPAPQQDNEEKIKKHQELMMKMASEILKTPAKSGKPLLEVEKVNPEIKKEEIITEIPETKPSPPKPPEDLEIITIVSIGVNTDPVNMKIEKKTNDNKITFKLNKKGKDLQRNKYFDSSENEESPKKEPEINKTKLTQMITPILQNASSKINSNSLITNITATLLQQSPKISPKYEQKLPEPSKIPNISKIKSDDVHKNDQIEHGEDKTVIVLNKNRKKPETVTSETQTDDVIFIEENVKEKLIVKEKKPQDKEVRDKLEKSKDKKSNKDKDVREKVDKSKVREKESKPVRNYRRRSSSSSSSESNASVKCKRDGKTSRQSRRHSHRTSSSNSLSSSLGSRWSRSRSRSRSRSHSVYSQSSYYSESSRSRSRSITPSRTRWRSRSRSSYYRRSPSRSRSRYSNSRNSRSQSRIRSRSRSRRRRELEQERMREVEERRVIYVGKISKGTSKADLRRRFQSFGPITNVSVHFRDHGDNYGFVTFAYKVDAYEAVEHGNDDPNFPKYDISFGGRRAFCRTRYSDLDNIEPDSTPQQSTIFRQDQNDSFDKLLREAQAKLRKRKV